MAYAEIEPFGEERADWRIAQLCVLVARGLGSKSAAIKDFMLCDTPPKREQSTEQMKQVFKSFMGKLKNVHHRKPKRKAKP